MTDIDLEPSHRRMIERDIGRALTDTELSPVTSVEALTDAHREVIRRIGVAPLSVAYLSAVAPGVRDALTVVDRIINGHLWKRVQPWSLDSGLGRWRFRIAGGDQATVAHAIDTIVANAAPFGRVQSVPRREAPAELVLDVSVTTEDGPRDLRSAAGITFEIVDGGVEIVLLLDVDIHAYVTWKYIDNAELAAVNAPRLAHLLGVFRDQLHATLVESNGLLPADETGFTAR